MQARELVGQAKGILMTRHNLGPEQSSDLLLRRCEQVGRGLRDVAEDLIRGAIRRAPAANGRRRRTGGSS